MVKLNPYPYLAALIALVALYASHRGIVAYEVKEAVKIENTRLTNLHNIALLKSIEEARVKETKLELSAIADKRTKDETINRISDERDAALKRLRNRPARPSTPNPPQDAPIGKACTARELYREDAEFLTREAARANQVLAERNYYYQRYESVRKELNGINATN